MGARVLGLGRWMWILVLCGGMCGAAGCAKARTNQAAGEACNRTAECADGLACVEHICGKDLGDLTANGMVPELPDAGGNDAATPLDGQVPMDSSTPPMDSAMPMMDANMPMQDASMPGMDAAAGDAG